MTNQRPTKRMKDTLTVQTSYTLPPDTNHYGTMFGGKLMANIDETASIAAAKLARTTVVTASTDSVDFIKPIGVGDVVTVEAMVTWTGRSSMEVFVKVLAEHLTTGKKEIAALSFLTFVALGEDGKSTSIPSIVPETEEEIWLNESAQERATYRKKRKQESLALANMFSPK